MQSSSRTIYRAYSVQGTILKTDSARSLLFIIINSGMATLPFFYLTFIEKQKSVSVKNEFLRGKPYRQSPVHH